MERAKIDVQTFMVKSKLVFNLTVGVFYFYTMNSAPPHMLSSHEWRWSPQTTYPELTRVDWLIIAQYQIKNTLFI